MDFRSWLRSLHERFDRGINRDEEVVFYPSYGFREPGGRWRLEVRGVIFEGRLLLRRITHLGPALVGASSMDELAAMAEASGNSGEGGIRRFKQRTRALFVDSEGGERFEVSLTGGPGDRFEVGASDALGYFTNLLTLSDHQAAAQLQESGEPWVPFVAADNDGERFFSGRSQLLPATGVTVVSDIDDTIKDSNVSDKVQLALNTLFQPFKVVPGMAEVYRSWQRRGASFVYLTNSPYQLYEPLTEFLQQQLFFPQGAYYMRRIDWLGLQQTIAELIAPDEDIEDRNNPKKLSLIPILERFPDRRFILIGDSTEKDGPIYADLFFGRSFPDGVPAKAYRDRIAKIYIRRVANSGSGPLARVQAAVDEVNAEGGEALLFTDPEEIRADAGSVFEDS